MISDELMIDRNLPASMDAEKILLGSILIENDFIDEAGASIHAADFAWDAHRRIFGRMVEMRQDERQIDIATLGESLRITHELDAVGGMAYLFSLTEGLPRKISIREYLRIVGDKAQLRGIIALAERAALEATEGDKPLEVIERVQDALEAILDGSDVDDPLVSSYTTVALDNFLAEKKLKVSPGLSYGDAALDEFTGGMRRGEVTVVGARSGVGKTSFLCQTAVANAQAGIPTLLFSLEMTREQILRRIWSMVSGVAYIRITDPWLSNVEDEERIKQAAMLVADWPLRIYDQSELTLAKIIALARVGIRRHGVRMIGLDYAQEVDAPGKDERTKVMAIARKLARMVKHENASLMLLSQLTKTNRENYSRPPVVGDLIESGKLENVAHVVMLLHRPWDADAGRISRDAEIHVPKQRRRETGILAGTFDAKTVTFHMNGGNHEV